MTLQIVNLKNIKGQWIVCEMEVISKNTMLEALKI